ncbi:MAG: hypothetical protein RL477_465 [Pseudomonadota bacterium]|jgi:hypothetical protein
MAAGSTTPLKLSANDVEDLTVISACLQDAVTLGSEVQFLPKEHKFAAVFSRFRWEDHHADGVKRWVRAGIHFNSVLGVQSKGLQRDADTVLELLALEATPGSDGSATVQLSFAGGASIRLQVECIDCHLTDLGAPWVGRRLPTHPTDRG